MVTSMLEKAIEIEGLLRIIRDGEPLPETYKLLRDKIEHLASEAASLAAEAIPQASEEERPIEEISEVDFIMAAPEKMPEPPKVDFTAPEPQIEKPLDIQKDAIDETIASTAEPIELDLDLEEEDDIILSFDDITEPIMVAEEHLSPAYHFNDPEVPLVAAPDIELPTSSDEGHISVERPEETTEDEKIRNEDTNTESNDEAKEGLLRPETSQPASLYEKNEPRKQVKLRSAFSLNDRFLYARELFNGNMKMFDATLDSLEGITAFSVIEDYFYNELGWNPEDPNVASFMERLKGKS